MRTLILEIQAKRDDIERIYRPTVEISFRIDHPYTSDILSWKLQELLKKHPWNDKRARIGPNDRRIFGLEEAREVQGFTDFHWDEKRKCFRTGSRVIALRRGQLIAFENWVQSLVDGFVKESLPGIHVHEAYGIVTYARDIRSK
jgi:hypothetical protein